MTTETNRFETAENTEEQDETLRKRLVDIGWQVLTEYGYSGASLDVVVRRSGAANESVLRWWPTKSALALDCLIQRVQQRSDVQKGDTVRVALLNLVESFGGIFRDPYSEQLMRALIAASLDDRSVAIALRDRWLEPGRARVGAVLARGLISGELRGEIDIAAVTDAIFGPVCLRLLFGPKPLDRDLVRSQVDGILDGIRNDV